MKVQSFLIVYKFLMNSWNELNENENEFLKKKLNKKNCEKSFKNCDQKNRFQNLRQSF